MIKKTTKNMRPYKNFGRKDCEKSAKDCVCLRLFLELLLAVIVSCLVELGLNFPSINEGYAPVDMSGEARTEDGKLIYSKSFDCPTYVKKLIIQGEFRKRRSYTVNLTTINHFGVRNEKTLTDKVYPELGQAFTNIGERVASIEVEFEKPKALTLTGISYSNQVQFQKYRMLLVWLLAYLSLLLILEKDLVAKKVEVFYLAFALGAGALIIGVSGPCAITWDEEVHFSQVYSMNFGSEVTWNAAAWLNRERGLPSVNTGEELFLLKQYMNEMVKAPVEVQPGGGFQKEYLEYLPMILFFRLGGLLGLPFSVQFAMGRFGNLLACALLNYLAICLAKRKKLLIACICMMPTPLFQSSMYTYDGLIFSAITLGVVLCMNGAENGKRTREGQRVSYAVVCLLFGLGCLAKPVYIPLFLLPLCMAFSGGRAGTAKKRRYITAAAVVFAALCAFFLLSVLSPVLENLMAGNAAYGGDIRGGNTGMVGQLLSILEHPAAFLKTMVHQVFTMDNFRNFGDKTKNQFMVTNLMFLNMYVLGNLKDAWSLILIPLLFLLFLAEPEGEKPLPALADKRKMRLASGGAAAFSALLIWLAMYLAFTPIGSEIIEGVQARYFLPLFLPFAYAVWNGRLRLDIQRTAYCRLVLGTCLLLSGVCFYQTLIGGRAI